MHQLNENATYQNLLDSARFHSVPRVKFIAWNAYLRKDEKSQFNNLSAPLKKPEKEEK